MLHRTAPPILLTIRRRFALLAHSQKDAKQQTQATCATFLTHHNNAFFFFFPELSSNAQYIGSGMHVFPCDRNHTVETCEDTAVNYAAECPLKMFFNLCKGIF